MRTTVTYLALLAGAGLLGAQTAGPKMFHTPEEARDGLIQAAAKGLDAIKEMMGPGSADILRTGDEVADNNLLEKFKTRIAEKTALEPDEMNRDRATLLIGNEEWPFAVPLIRKNGQWYFDAKEGKAEIRRRVIGANELDAMQVCRGYVEAQEMYAEKDRDGKGVLQYAAKIASSPGKKDGLYWPSDDSPIAESVAKAIAQGYPAPTGTGKGYHGYQYKILLAQGPDALDGEQDYVAHGLMIGGFAMVAWPVEYGVSGIMSFIVNQDGTVYEKDLGPQTAALARAMTKFNPDKSWRVSPDSPDSPE
ncbi:conserved exported hypothetical protein [Candidatus Sulfopaludibacter sp. SbA3]|nr:conserved exported hypothetical protein [Candidatus Sulfopaludibacter sp. SbA3]